MATEGHRGRQVAKEPGDRAGTARRPARSVPDPRLPGLRRQRTEERHRALQLEHTELERMAVAGELAGIVAHEIRTPLNALSINVQLLERMLRRGGPENMDRANGLVGTLKGEIDRINNLLSDYLQALRPPSQLAVVPFSLSRTVEDAIRFVEPKATTSEVQLEVALPLTLPQAEGDEDRLRQVLLNVLLNAIQAMPEGGMVYVSAKSRDGAIRLEIRDTGPGIPTDDLERVFQPFVTTKKHGTGLGLAISDRLIRAMGGSIAASSTLGKGTCFEIVLPQSVRDDTDPEAH